MTERSTLAPTAAQLRATRILDHDRPKVRDLALSLIGSDAANRSFLQKAHLHLVQTMRPVYSVDEWQPVSRTLQKACGSCSQRMACLEAFARAVGIPTRVHAFRIQGRFWYPRFRYVRIFLPNSIRLLWPQFFLEGTWLDFDELYGPMEQLVAGAEHGFKNDGESIFEAVQHSPIDFCGKTCSMYGAKPEYNLSRFVVADEGFFDTRDEVLERFGSFQHTLKGNAFEAIFGGRKAS
jgi:hypothetical protein